ncbi:MAG: hypothetical protein JRJ54_13725 [Deltaproteobacteria bacterium]|nr:hypothetical protein [Deltaproteobacteria bacterium]
MKRRPKLTEYRFDLWAEQLSEWIKASVSPFAGDTPEKQRARIERARWDRLFFFETYLPHYFHAEFGEFHDEWSDLADIKDEAVFVAAPREHAKSTFFTFGVPIHDICYAARHFILIVSDTNDQATGFALPIRLELEDNVRLRHDFGTFRGRKWSENDFTTKNGIRVLARGRGEKLRGVKNLQWRPDRAVVDDFENDTNVRNPRLVKQGKDWLQKAVLGSMGEGYSFTMIGNIFSPKSILAQFIAEKDEDGPVYVSRIYAAIKDDGEPLWPEVWSKERLEKKRRQMGTVNFNAEMLNRVGADESPFREEWFVFIEIVSPKAWRFASFLDPSAKSGMANDYKAIVTVALDPETMRFDVAHAWIRHATVNAMIEACYRINGEYGGTLGIETNMLEDFLRETFNRAAVDRKKYLPIVEVHHSTQKEGRIINTLSPLIEFGKLRFIKGHSDQDLLVEQLIYILDKNVNDDGPDALEGAVSLLQGAGEIEHEATGVKRAFTRLSNFLRG